MELHDFQRTILADYFAGCRETLVLMPKKGGKSTLLAAVALHRLLAMPDVNVAIVAASREQAMVLFDQARGFVQRSTWLHHQVRVLRGHREIRRMVEGEHPMEFSGLIKVYAADADTADGWLGDLALVDELHRHKSGDLYGVLRDGLGPRNGQLITISTAGNTEDSPLGELRSRAYAMPGLSRDGAYRTVRNSGFAMHEWALEPEEDRHDLELVKTANPAPWQTVDELRNRHDSPSMTEGQWARFACGVWGLGGDAAFDKKAWAGLASPGEMIAKDRLVVLGFDGARRQDTSGLVAVDVETGHIQVVGYWPRPADADDDWEIPEHEVREQMTHAFEYWDVWQLYADPPYWDYTVDVWAGEFGMSKVTKFWTQSRKMMAKALRAFRNDMVPERMSHDGNVHLAEHIGNSMLVETNMRDGDEMLWTIQKDSRRSPRKIDLAMAACLAWTARGDAIEHGALNRPVHARATW